jgi:predicted PurR-regulated permease PerM
MNFLDYLLFREDYLDKRTFFVLILFGLALTGAYTIYSPFLLPMVVATLLAMATSNLTKDISRVLKSQKLATMVMTALLILLILAPIIYVATIGLDYLKHLDPVAIKISIKKLKEVISHIPHLNNWANEYLRVDKILPYFKEISLFFTKIGSKGLGFVKNIFFVIIFYSVIVYYHKRFFEIFEILIPASQEESKDMVEEVASTMEIVLYSIVTTAIFEGALFGMFVSYFGFNGLLLGVLYGFASLIPVVGGLLVWLPISLYAWSEMGSSTALIIVSYSIIVISIIADTLIKPMIIKAIKDRLYHHHTKINELVIFFSILAGMSSFGFWGMILGPAITTFLVAATRIYIKHSELLK